MLTSCPPLDSTFSNPAAARPSLSHHHHHTTSGDHHKHCHLLSTEHTWLGGCCIKPSAPDHHWKKVPDHPKNNSNKAEAIKLSAVAKAMHKTMLILNPKHYVSDPEDDLRSLINNEKKLELCGYYYGSLSWVDASHVLKRCAVGTFLVRDSEHASYLYALSVQTRKGPTSCRIEYDRGCFRLDSSESLADKMPRFDCVTDLIDYYIELTEYLSRKNTSKVLSPVWLDMDEENTMDIPVQIYKPLLKGVRNLQHMCRENIVRRMKKRYASGVLTRTIVEADSEYKSLPNILKEYICEYLFPPQ